MLRHTSHCPLHEKKYRVGAQLGINETQIYIADSGHWIAFYKYYEKNYIMFTGLDNQWCKERSLINKPLSTIETLAK